MNSPKSPYTIRYRSAEKLHANHEEAIKKNVIDANAILEKMTDKPHNKLTDEEIEQIITGATDLQKRAYSALLLARAYQDAVADDRSKKDNYTVYDDSAISYGRHTSHSFLDQMNGADVGSMTNRTANISA